MIQLIKSNVRLELKRSTLINLCVDSDRACNDIILLMYGNKLFELYDILRTSKNGNLDSNSYLELVSEAWPVVESIERFDLLQDFEPIADSLVNQCLAQRPVRV